MTRASRSRLSFVRTCLTWSLVFGFWCLILASQALSQKIPVIGGYTWVYDGTAPDTNYLYRNAQFRSLTHLPKQGVLVAGVHTSRWPSVVQMGAILTLDERTGAVIRLDSVCPRVGNFSIRSAWLNDSGTVMCYACMNDRPRLVEYPSMREIEDTVLWMKDDLGQWVWAEGRVSSTGRYLILYTQPINGNQHRLWLYDRLTGERFDLGCYSRVQGSGEDPFSAPQFSGDDRLLVTRAPNNRGFTVWDVERRREIGSYDDGHYYNYMLSHTGGKLLISSYVWAPTDGLSVAIVYDAWTMTPEWYRPIKNHLSITVDHVGALTFDGTEVILAQAIQTDTGLRWGHYWYVLPDTSPRGYITPRNNSHWLQIKTQDVAIAGGINTRPIFYSWNAALSVATTPREPQQPLYPNPTTGEVVVNVGQCQSESWQLRLSDQAGTLVKEGVAFCSGGSVRMTLHALPAGQYYLQIIEPASGRSVQAIVVLHR